MTPAWLGRFRSAWFPWLLTAGVAIVLGLTAVPPLRPTPAEYDAGATLTALTVVGLIWAAYYAARTLQHQRVHDAEEAAKRQRAAVAVLHAEHSRLRRLALRWERKQIHALIRLGVGVEQDVTPPDWGSVMQATGVCGGPTAIIAGFAFGFMSDAVMQVRQLRTRSQLRRRVLSGKPFLQTAEQQMKWLDDYQAVTRKIVDEIASSIDSAADLMLSAIRHAPYGGEPIAIEDTLMEGEAGARVYDALKGKTPSDAHLEAPPHLDVSDMEDA